MKILILCFILLTFAGLSNDCGSRVEQKNAVVSNAPQFVAPKVTPTPKPENVPDDLIWHGENGDFDITWSKGNIVAKKISSGQTAFSARELAKMRLKKDFKENFGKNGEPYFEDFTFRYRIISIVGSLLSLDEKTSYSPQSYSKETYLTVDLSKSPETVSLTNFFTEKEILNALASNELIAKAIKQKNAAKPTTLAEFRSDFNKTVNEATEVSDSQLDKCWFPENIFKSFAFDKIKDEKIIVDLAIPCRAEMREDDVYSLKIMLLPPDKLVNDLFAAMNKKLLAEDFENLVSKDEAVIIFNSNSFK